MSNPYYTPTGNPPNQTRGTSALVRNEFDSIEGGFDDVYAEILALAAAIGVAVTVSEVPVASASTTDIGNGYGPVLLITGSNPINSFGANYKGGIFLRFQGSLQINHSSALQCPGGLDITTQADDACIAVPIGDPSNGWRIMAYCRVSQGIIDDIAVKTSSTYANPSWLTSLAWAKITGRPTTLAGYGITDAPQKDGTGATGTWPVSITGAPGDNTVGTGKIVDSSVTLAKLSSAVLRALAGGRCNLAKDGSDLKLSPFNGNTLIINGSVETVPSAGVTLAASGLTPGTLYYIYAYMSSGTMTLEASTTAYATDSTTGVTIKSGDASRTLVGMARPITGPAWQDTAAQRFVRSWFNDPGVACTAFFTASRSTSSTSYTELNSEIRNEFLIWSGEIARISTEGYQVQAAAGNSFTSIGIDSTSTAEDTCTGQTNITSGAGSANCSVIKKGLSEGYHYATLLAKVAAANASWQGGSTPGDRCVVQTFIGAGK